MSTYSFKLPDIGEGIAEAEVVAWHVAVGDVVEEDSPIADLMTDKATVEMSAPVSGKVLSLSGDVGDMVAIGAILVEFEVAGDDAASSEPAEEKWAEVLEHEGIEAAGLTTDKPDKADDQALEAVIEAAPEPAPSATPQSDQDHAPYGHRVLASPAVRKRAADLAIDLSQVATAVDGRVRHTDLDAFLNYNRQGGYSAPAKKCVDERVKVVGLRRRIAENMAASKRNIPHFSYVEEVDVTKLEEMRSDLNAARGAKPKLTILPLLITAICKTLPDYPMLNAHFDDEAGIVSRFGSMHIGIATQTDAGLMVPVIRNAEGKNLWQLAAEIVRLADAARSGKAKSDELSGSTLTITSLGPLGGIATTPVINRPEVAIIGPNKVVERPIVRNGEVDIAKMMNVSISCDHRVVDGWDAANFVQDLKRKLETPALLFVD